MSRIPYLVRVITWLAIDLVSIFVGAMIGAFLTPKVNPHNDWGVTGMIYTLTGALLGNATTIAALLWRYGREAVSSYQLSNAKSRPPGEL